MPIPSEFTFANEAEFVSRLLIPLLHRLGYSIVVDYHGASELGKDLVFGEIDRFGHVRYHGLQAKYAASIGLSDIQELISDAQQAFASPFKHPHTGASERISTFYAVTGGSISDQARTHFFSSLLQLPGDNVRLIDGKGLLALDRCAAANQAQSSLPELTGILLEIKYNRRIDSILSAMFGIYDERCSIDGVDSAPSPFLSHRFRVSSMGRYLERPFLISFIPPSEIETLWTNLSSCNQLMDSTMGLTTVRHVANAVSQIRQNMIRFRAHSKELEEHILEVIKTFAPLSGM